MKSHKKLQRVDSTASDLADLAETPDGIKVYNVSKSRLVSLINWVHVFGTYLPLLWFFIVGILFFQILSVLYANRFDLQQFYNDEISTFTLARPVALDLGWKTMVSYYKFLFIF